MESICGVNCDDCNYLKSNKCKGCKNTNGCPFGKKCFIAKYIEIGGKEYLENFKNQLIDEINSINIDGMEKISELYPLNGSFVNLEFYLPNGKKVKYLNDDEIYYGTQIECIYNDDDIKKCFGIVANMNFILICEYEEDGKNSELLLYKKR